MFLTDLTSRSELSEVKSVDVADFNTGEVSNGLGELLALAVVNEKRTLSKLVVLSSHLSLTSSLGLGVNDSGDVSVDTSSLQESDGILSLFDGFELVVNDEGNHGGFFDSVTYKSANQLLSILL